MVTHEEQEALRLLHPSILPSFLPSSRLCFYSRVFSSGSNGQLRAVMEKPPSQQTEGICVIQRVETVTQSIKLHIFE